MRTYLNGELQLLGVHVLLLVVADFVLLVMPVVVVFVFVVVDVGQLRERMIGFDLKQQIVRMIVAIRSCVLGNQRVERRSDKARLGRRRWRVVLKT